MHEVCLSRLRSCKLLFYYWQSIFVLPSSPPPCLDKLIATTDLSWRIVRTEAREELIQVADACAERQELSLYELSLSLIANALELNNTVGDAPEVIRRRYG